MATYDEVLGWIEKEREAIKGITDAKNARDNEAAIKDLKSKQHDILTYNDKVTEVASQTTDSEKVRSLKEAYDALQASVEKRIGCLEKINQISQLEDSVSSLSQVFDLRASSLVQPSDLVEVESLLKPEKNLSGFIGQSAQDCIFGVHDNWRLIASLLKCVQIHLQNGAAYNEFFHEIQESEPWMLDDLLQILKFFETRVVTGDDDEAKKLATELEKIHLTLRQWEAKTTRLWETATKLIPVPLRTKRNEEPHPARALTDYSSKDVSVRENEDIVLLDSSEPKLWKIKNGRGQEGQVPATVVLIPGPDGDAIKAAVKLRLQLLTSWTNVLKLIGKRLVYFMLIVFKASYTPDEIAALKSMDDLEKENLLKMLNYIEEVFNRFWSDHDGYTSVQERILVLRMILEGQSSEGGVSNEELYKHLLLLINTLYQATTHYKHTLDDWEKFKVVLEASQSPELMLIVDKWEQLKFVTKEYFSKFWKTSLPLDGLDGLDGGLTSNERSLDEREVVIPDEIIDETVTKTESKPLHYEAVIVGEGEELDEFDADGNRIGGADYETGGASGVAREKKTAETEQLSQAEMEENKTFIISAVINPADQKEISLQEAIMLGVIKPDDGVYVNTTTGETTPIPVAMGSGLIKVTLSKMKRTTEKKSSIGIITVKTTREETRPYTILSVKDTKTDEDLTPDEATKRGILREAQGLYVDLKTGNKQLITEAADAGLVKVEYFGEQSVPEVVSTTYAVRAVVDRKEKKTVTFSEAVKRGIIEKGTGNFVDTETGEKMYVGDAIVRGFLKARIVEDPSSLNINPENTILIDKTQTIRERLLKPLKIISAFKMAGKK